MNDQPDHSREPSGKNGHHIRRGARATLVGQALVQLGSMTATMILARLLTPAEFGLVAITQSVMGAVALASLSGISASLVSRQDEPRRLASTYFWLALMFGFSVVAITTLLAGPMTRALGQPDAAPYLRVLSIGFPLTLVTLIPTALLQRQMRFSALNSRLLLSSAVYFVTEVILALYGLGAWAVIIGQLAGAIAGLIGAFSAAKWMPRLIFDLPELRRDIPMLGGISASRALEYVQKNVDYWAASRGLGAAALGQYYVAYVLPNIVRLRISTTYRTVMIPAVAHAVNTEAGIQRWRSATIFMLGLGIPALCGLGALAAPIIALLFGSQWGAAVAPMQIIAVGTLLDLMIQAVGAMALARRQIRAHTMIIAVRSVLTALLVVGAMTLRPSLTSVAIAVVGATAVALALQEFQVARPLGIGFSTIARPVMAFAGLSGAMSITLYVGSAYIWSGSSPAVQVVLGVVVGIGVYGLLGLLLARELMLSVLSQIVAVGRGK